MNKTVIVLNLYRQTNNLSLWQNLKILSSLGASVIISENIADVSLARNVSLSLAVDNLKNRDTVLLIDDDIVFNTLDAVKIVNQSRTLKRAVSGIYARSDKLLSAQRYNSDTFLTGLGFLAIPAEKLIEVKGDKFTVELEQTAYMFCNSHVANGKWVAEDYDLCIKLGGVLLSDTPVGHIKSTVLYPPIRT